MKQFEKSYIDALIRDLQNAYKLIGESKDYSIIMKWNDTTGVLIDAEQYIIAAIGHIQRESVAGVIDSHQELE